MARGLVKWTQPELDYLKILYLRQQLSPKDCVDKLNKKFGKSWTAPQIHKAVEHRGWAAQKKLVAERSAVECPSVPPVGHLVTLRRRSHAAVMDAFVEKAEKGANKAFQFVSNATTARELNAAASAAKSLVTTYRLCAGMDAAGSGSGNVNTFNFNFAGGLPPPEKQAEKVSDPVVDVSPEPVSS